MVYKARIRLLSLKTSLANLPLSIYSPLVQAQKRPQSLALHVISQSGKESYLGWSGLSSSAAAPGDWLEVDPGVAAGFGWVQGQEVEISIVNGLSKAKSISVAPLTPEDWDMISLHADYLEQNLLFTVRVGSIHEILEIWIKGKYRVQMRVEKMNPSKQKVLLLSQDTEVIIAPMLRPPQPTPEAPSSAPQISKNPGSSSAESHSKSAAKMIPKLKSPTTQSTISTHLGAVLRSLPSRISPSFSIDSGFEPECGPVIYLSKDTLNLIPNKPSKTGMSVQLEPLDVPSDSEALIQSEDGVDEAQGGHGLIKLTVQCIADQRIPYRHFMLPGGGENENEGFALWKASWADSTSTSTSTPGPRSASPELDLEQTDRAASKTKSGSSHCKRVLPGIQSTIDEALVVMVNLLILQSGMFFAGPGNGNEISSVSRTLLLTGNPRSGKTTIARELTERLEEDARTLCHPIYMDLTKLAEERIPAIKEEFIKLVRKANWLRPSCLVLDGLDALCGVELEHMDTTRPRQIAEFMVSILEPSSASSEGGRLKDGVVVIATANSALDVHPLLSAKHVFSGRVGIHSLTKDERKEVLDHLLATKIAQSTLRVDPTRPPNIISLATELEGYLVSDLKDLVDRAVQESAIRNIFSRKDEFFVSAEDFDNAHSGFVPFSLRDVKLHKSEVKWDDIGGLIDVRRTLRETLEWPTKYAAIFTQSPLRLRSGLLLYGYPGCGKTLLASAVAKECGLNFISVKGPEILSKYIGSSEKSVRDLFERATAAKPCVLFFDEFDSIAPKRGHDSTGVTDRVVNQMLTQMDGAEGLEGVYVLAATSRPDLIDPALLRPGRLDKSLLCPMPSESDRLDILRSLTRNLKLDPAISLPNLARQTENFSGADLGGLIGSAHLHSVHSTLDDDNLDTSPNRSVRNGEEIKGEVLVLSGGNKGKKLIARSRAEEGALKKRVAVMLNAGEEDPAELVGKIATKRDRPIMRIEQNHMDRALTSVRPSVPEAERRRLARIYSDLPPSCEVPSHPDDKDYTFDECVSHVSDESSYRCAADSGAAQHNLILLQSLKQSRYFYSTRLLPTFRSPVNPPNPIPAPHTLQDLGTVSMLIGPCQFNQCTLYQVQYLSGHLEGNLDRTSAQGDVQNTYPETDALEDLSFDKLGWLDLEQVGHLNEVHAVGLNIEGLTNISTVQSEKLIGEAGEKESLKSGGTMDIVRPRRGGANEEPSYYLQNQRCAPHINSSKLEASVWSSDARRLRKQKSQNAKPTFTPELKKAIQLTATLEIRLAELLYKTYLERAQESELMELNGIMKAIESDVDSGRFDWELMLAKAKNAQRVQRMNKEQKREEPEKRRDRSASHLASSHRYSNLSPSSSANAQSANSDDLVQSNRPIEATSMKLSSAPMLWSRSSPKCLATLETGHYPNRQPYRLSPTPTLPNSDPSPLGRLRSADLVSRIHIDSLNSFDHFAFANPNLSVPTGAGSSLHNTRFSSPSVALDHSIAHSVNGTEQMVKNGKRLNASDHPHEQGLSMQNRKAPIQHHMPVEDHASISSERPLHTLLPVNDVVVSFPGDTEELFLIPLSRSIISRDLAEEGGSIRISFFTPTPPTILPPPPVHYRLNSLNLTPQHRGSDNPNLVRKNSGVDNDERTELMTIVIENYSEETWKALESSYLGHLKVIFEGMNGREERISEFQSMLRLGLPSSPATGLPTIPMSEESVSAQIDEEQRRAALERRDQETKFFRDEAARVYFETNGQWPEDYEPPFTFEEFENLQENIHNLEDLEIPVNDENVGRAVTPSPTPAAVVVGERRKSDVKGVTGRKRKQKGQKAAVASDEEDILPDNLSETIAEYILSIPNRSQPNRKMKTPDYTIESDRESTPLTPIASSDSDEDSSETVVVERDSSQYNFSEEQPPKASTYERRKPQTSIRVLPKPKKVARYSRRTTEKLERRQHDQRSFLAHSTPAYSKVSPISRVPNRTGDSSGRDIPSTRESESKNQEGDRSDSDDSDLLIM
ncbi:AAA-type ATPase [Phaffia rhodozyma]|uniref:Peroxisomal ATPase PEX1 n=1 Tax=Phaffia rhodozyma TaxID=264483 RepID=A0A0F7SI42_PHARH|nr:AAA-type ATPase [Phaffia rhodozyma]